LRRKLRRTLVADEALSDSDSNVMVMDNHTPCRAGCEG